MEGPEARVRDETKLFVDCVEFCCSGVLGNGGLQVLLKLGNGSGVLQ